MKTVLARKASLKIQLKILLTFLKKEHPKSQFAHLSFPVKSIDYFVSTFLKNLLTHLIFMN